jgi:protein TonB
MGLVLAATLAAVSPSPEMPWADPAALTVPAPGTAPEIVARYQAMVSTWFEKHKTYPEAARRRGEEGNVGLRFRVDRGGHVLFFKVIRSSGHGDLDRAVRELMRDAVLPPFPPGLAEPHLDVSVTIRFSLGP